VKFRSNPFVPKNGEEEGDEGEKTLLACLTVYMLTCGKQLEETSLPERGEKRKKSNVSISS